MISERKLCVLVVDDHDIVHWGLRVLLHKQTWLGRHLEASTAEEAIGLARRYDPDVALLDVHLGADTGTAVCRRLLEVSPSTRVLLFSGSVQLSPAAIRAAGAAGFIGKDWPGRDIARAVRMVGLGMDVGPPAEERLLTGVRLSMRELEVLRLLAEGDTIPAVADHLFLSAHTVKGHARSIYRKVGARNRAEAVIRAERLGLLL